LADHNPTEKARLLLQIPEDLRLEALEMVAKGVDLKRLVEFYQRGFKAQIGASGQHPFGKLGRDDEGELTVAVATDVRNGVVRMQFGKPVAWLALPASTCRGWAKMLLERADELEKKMS
jgi:hypothetical protein